MSKKPMTSWNGATDDVEIRYRNLNEKSDDTQYTGSCMAGKKGLIVKILLLVVIFVVGLLIGYVIRRQVHDTIVQKSSSVISKSACPGDQTGGKSDKKIKDYDADIARKARDLINADSIRQWLKSVANLKRRGAHFASTGIGNQVADIFAKHLRDNNFDKVNVKKYYVQLSEPNWGDVNYVKLVNNNTIKFDAPSTKRGGNRRVDLHPYVVNSKNGTASGKLVYANYGSKEDIQFLRKNHIPRCGKDVIIMMRLYGGHELSQKLSNLLNSCSRTKMPGGIILFPDIVDVNANHTYKNGTWWMDETIAPSVVLRHASSHLWGDPNTPFRPATEFAYADNIYSVDIPNIVMQTVSFKDAQFLMKDMNGTNAPPNFIGGLNIDYKLGPGYSNSSERSGWTVKMKTSNIIINQKEIRNIIGIMRGSVEPDRYVVIGTHHDSLTTGAVDPGTGLAVAMELARIIGSLVKEGTWRPRRSIIFASWDASEYGAYGSQEWIEDHLVELYGKMVTYINLADAITGNQTFHVQANLLLNELIYNVTKLVPCHQHGHQEMSVFQQWTNNQPHYVKANLLGHLMETPGGANYVDSEAFSKRVLIPVMDLHYTFSKVKYPHLKHYPVFHTPQDTYEYIEKFIDRDLKAHQTLSQITIELIMRLADSLILPFDCHTYVSALQYALKNLINSHRDYLEKHLKIDSLKDAIVNLTETNKEFRNAYKSKSIASFSNIEARHINTKLLDAFRYLLVTQKTDSILAYSHSNGGAHFAVFDKLIKSGNSLGTKRHLASLIQWLRVAAGILGRHEMSIL